MTAREGHRGDPLEMARDALAHGRWTEALDALDRTGPDDPEALELRATAHYGNGELEASISAWEALHRLHADRGERVEAARAAASLAMFLMIDTGLLGAVRGWVRTAERHLEGLRDTPPHALVALVRTYERFMSGDLAGTKDYAAQAQTLGQRLGVMPAVVIGRVATARARIFDGEVEAGIDQLDDIATLLMSGSVDPLTTGMMYCELICAAQGLGLHDRAVEWTDMMERWRHGAAFGGLNGRCRVHRAELLRVQGTCQHAEEQALLACEELRPWMRREFGWPLVELGNIRLRKGDLAGAEEAFLAAHERAWDANPGMALLRLAQGDTAGALHLIRDAIDHPADLPWKERPPIGELRFAPLREAQAEIAHAAGDTATTREAADALELILARFPTPSRRAGARLAAARALLLEGRHDAAVEAAREAVVGYTEVGAPFDAAIARTVLAAVHEAAGNDVAARLEWRTARQAFAGFGAELHAAACDEHLGAPARAAVGPGLGDHAAVFRSLGDVREVSLAGTSVLIRDFKGLRYVARLLAEPGREFHVLDLSAVDNGTIAVGRATVATDGDGRLAAAGLPVIDDAAREAYRRRLAEVDDDIDDAIANNDPVRRELAERDREYLVRELTSALGLAGRPRSTGGSAERARTAVARAIRYSLDQLAAVHPVAAEHLRQHVTTGTYCSYTPGALAPVTWQT